MKPYQRMYMDGLTGDLADVSLKIDTFKLNPEHPVEWVSGYWMPVNCEFGRLLFNYLHRTLVKECFDKLRLFNGIGEFEVVAGTSLSGASPATTLADAWQKPLIIVRNKPKEHGMKNSIEGILEGRDLEHKRVVLIEDRIETGRSSARAVQTIRDARGRIDYCLTIFSYDFDAALQVFNGKSPFDDSGHKLTEPCKIFPILTYNKLIEIASERNHFNQDQIKFLNEWHKDAFHWGENHGHPRKSSK